jgi:predicted RNase H-like HicB family nuclease
MHAAAEKELALTIEFEKENDGRVIAEIPELPGVMAYGRTHKEAALKVQALAYRVLADRLEIEKKTTEGVKFAFA